MAVLWRAAKGRAGNDSKAHWFGFQTSQTHCKPDHQEVTCVLQLSRPLPRRWHHSPPPALPLLRWDLESTLALLATMTTMSMRRRSIAAQAFMATPTPMSTTLDPTSSFACPAAVLAAANISIGMERVVWMRASIRRTCAECDG